MREQIRVPLSLTTFEEKTTTTTTTTTLTTLTTLTTTTTTAYKVDLQSVLRDRRTAPYWSRRRSQRTPATASANGDRHAPGATGCGCPEHAHQGWGWTHAALEIDREPAVHQDGMLPMEEEEKRRKSTDGMTLICQDKGSDTKKDIHTHT